MKRFLPIFLLALLLFPRHAFASVVCIPGTKEEIVGTDLIIQHPNIDGGQQVYAGVFNGKVDCVTPTLLYCTAANTGLCYPAQYVQSPNLSSHELVWILNNYYPAVPSMPSELATDPERAAAVQLAVWHFSDGVDISTGGNLPAVFDAARAIIAAALTATVPPTPTSLALTPPYSTQAPGTPVTVTATLRDQNGQPIAGYPISWTRTHAPPFSGSGLTDGNGQYPVSWNEVGNDAVTFSVDYTIPIGLHWAHTGCQDLVSGGTAPGHVSESWGPPLVTGASNTSWGHLRKLYR